MKTNTAKFLPIAEKFFTAYDAHDVDGRAGGALFHITATHVLDFPGGPSFAVLFHAKGGSF